MLVVFSHVLKAPGAEAMGAGFGWEYVRDFLTAAGHPCVWVFFVLSGFVMANRYQAPFSWRDFWHYLGRRVLRLWPIMMLSILVAVSILGLPALYVLLGNSLFLQELLVPTLPENKPLWSLSYEMSYYFLFGVVMLRKWPESFLLGCSLLGVLLACLFNWPVVEILIFAGFWYAGLWLARNRSKLGWLLVPGSEAGALAKILSLLCLAAAYGHANIVTSVLSFLHVHRPWAVGNIAIFPVYIAVVALALGYRLVGLRWVVFCVAGACVVRGFTLMRHFSDQALLLAGPMMCWLVLAVLFRFIPFPRSWSLNRLEKLGDVSYALYVFHWPILALMWLLFAEFGGLKYSIAFLLPFALFLLFGLSWFSEHFYQKWWVSRYRGFLKI